MGSLLHKEITEQVLASFFGVYDEHGFGFVEAVYQRSLVVELQLRGLEVGREVRTEIVYKGVSVGLYRADLIVSGKVLVEVKSIATLGSADERQVINYLKATGIAVGMLLNFGPRPQFRRLIYSRAH